LRGRRETVKVRGSLRRKNKTSEARIFIWWKSRENRFSGLGKLPGSQLIMVALLLPLDLFSGKSGSVIFLMQAFCLLTTKKLVQMAFIMNSNVIICEPNNL